MKNYLIGILFLISLTGLFFAIKANIELRSLYCNLNSAFFAEREYVYPVLRKIDDPDNYGKGIKNPFTSDTKYLNHCLNRIINEKNK